MNTTTVPRIWLPRREDGLDYGAKRAIVVRLFDANGQTAKELRWNLGSTSFVCRGVQAWHPSTLTLNNLLVLPYGPEWRNELHEGDRLSKKLLSRHASVITEAFGEGIIEAIRKIDLRTQSIEVRP